MYFTTDSYSEIPGLNDHESIAKAQVSDAMTVIRYDGLDKAERRVKNGSMSRTALIVAMDELNAEITADYDRTM